MFSPELLLAGLGLGAAYALAALGFVLIINAVGAVNFAQGDFVMAGGYVAVVVTALLPPSLAPGLLALPLVLVAMAVLGLLFSALAYLPLRGQPAVAVFISTIAVGLILRQSVNAEFGAAPRAGPPVLAPEMAGAMFSQVATISAAALLVAAVHGLLKHTQFGRHLRASAQDPEMAAAIGVPVTWMVMATFALATALAGVAGLLLSHVYLVQPEDGTTYMLKAYIAVTLGGWGRVGGAVLGALAIAVFETLVAALVSHVMAEVLLYLLVLAVLWWRPQGLMGEIAGRRA